MKCIEKLPQGTINCLDGEEFMKIIHKLMQQRDDLENKISMKTAEVETWLQVLQASSVDDVKELIETLPNSSEYSLEETTLLENYFKISKELTAYSYLGNCEVYVTEEGDTLLRFISTPSNKSSERFLILLTGSPENLYRVKHHNLPDTIPVAKLAEKYLEDQRGAEALHLFTTAIHQFTWALFHRLSQKKDLEKTGILGDTKEVYHNEGFTCISFFFKIIQDEKLVAVEFSLKYHPLDILPHEVKVEIINDEKHYPMLEESVSDLALEMKVKPFLEVLSSYFLGKQSQTISRSEQRDSESDSSSSSTTLFELF